MRTGIDAPGTVSRYNDGEGNSIDEETDDDKFWGPPSEEEPEDNNDGAGNMIVDNGLPDGKGRLPVVAVAPPRLVPPSQTRVALALAAAAAVVAVVDVVVAVGVVVGEIAAAAAVFERS